MHQLMGHTFRDVNCDQCTELNGHPATALNEQLPDPRIPQGFVPTSSSGLGSWPMSVPELSFGTLPPAASSQTNQTTSTMPTVPTVPGAFPGEPLVQRAAPNPWVSSFSQPQNPPTQVSVPQMASAPDVTTARMAAPIPTQSSSIPTTAPPSTPSPPVHSNVTCDMCNTTIVGVRHKCLDCRSML